MIISPNKHTNPNLTTVALTARAIKILSKRRTLPVTDLRKKITSVEDGTDKLFLPCLNLMYLLGLIEYRMKTDTVEYVGK